MISSLQLRCAVTLIAFAVAGLCPTAHAAEHITLNNGFELDCAHREAIGDRIRLYFSGATADSSSFLEVAAGAILRVEPVVAALPLDTPAVDIPHLLSQAGLRHRIDADMLAAVVLAESGGHTRAVSRTGARGLMQLMPGTAHQLGVTDAFAPDQNIAGGTAYLDHLLTRYHDDIALALAAYNAGPGAVDRYHGVPPFRETQAYVARVINEFNRRKRAASSALRVSANP